mmetsp:Transcript_22425/g.60648  ORF Transcript_22425/g.60648 Transcript_22425/m.60648 type:complete len:262 (+) Transcript_22425:3909-4694(+)
MSSRHSQTRPPCRARRCIDQPLHSAGPLRGRCPPRGSRRRSSSTAGSQCSLWRTSSSEPRLLPLRLVSDPPRPGRSPPSQPRSPALAAWPATCWPCPTRRGSGCRRPGPAGALSSGQLGSQRDCSWPAPPLRVRWPPQTRRTRATPSAAASLPSAPAPAQMPRPRRSSRGVCRHLPPGRITRGPWPWCRRAHRLATKLPSDLPKALQRSKSPSGVSPWSTWCSQPSRWARAGPPTLVVPDDDRSSERPMREGSRLSCGRSC